MRNWIGLAVTLFLFKTGALAVAQDTAAATAPDDSNTNAMTAKKPFDILQMGPLKLHPRISAGVVSDDNILFTQNNKESDLYWTVQPGLQGVIGDDAALIAMRDQHSDVLNITPGGIIVVPPAQWPGKLLMLDYAPRFKFYDKYSAYNAIDQFATFNLLWPMNQLILGFRQDYQLQKATIIEANQFASTETIATTLSAAYQFGDKTSVEGNFRRITIGYDVANLIGYTEYNTEDWFNYELTESMPVSVGVLAGYDDVAFNQSQTFEQLRARVRYNYTEKLVFDVSGGGELREYENGQSGTFSPVFSLSGSYQPAARTSVSLAGYRQQNASIYNGYNYTSTGVSLGLSQGITDRFTAGVNLGYNSLDFSPVTAGLVKYTQDYLTARVSLDVKILQHLAGGVYYQLTLLQSANTGNIRENQAGLNITLSY